MINPCLFGFGGLRHLAHIHFVSQQYDVGLEPRTSKPQDPIHYSKSLAILFMTLGKRQGTAGLTQIHAKQHIFTRLINKMTLYPVNHYKKILNSA